MLEKVLVPLDGSEISETVIPYAVELAGRLNSEVSLLYVSERSEAEHHRVFELYLEAISRQVAETVKQTYGKTGAVVKTIVAEGSAAAAIIDFSEKNDTGLIIMASHGRSGLMPWPVGSTAAKVSQHARVPVLLVRTNTPPDKLPTGGVFDKGLMPLDGSTRGEAGLPYVKEIAQQINMEVVLLHVVAPGQYAHTVSGLNYFSFPEQLVEKMKLDAGKYLETVRGRLSDTKAKVRYEVRPGDPASEILKFSADNSVDLVAISSHGRSGIERWMLGSVSYKVLHGGKTPLLLVRAQPGR